MLQNRSLLPKVEVLSHKGDKTSICCVKLLQLVSNHQKRREGIGDAFVKEEPRTLFMKSKNGQSAQSYCMAE